MTLRPIPGAPPGTTIPDFPSEAARTLSTPREPPTQAAPEPRSNLAAIYQQRIRDLRAKRSLTQNQASELLDYTAKLRHLHYGSQFDRWADEVHQALPGFTGMETRMLALHVACDRDWMDEAFSQGIMAGLPKGLGDEGRQAIVAAVKKLQTMPPMERHAVLMFLRGLKIGQPPGYLWEMRENRWF